MKRENPPIIISGVVPDLWVKADLVPNRSESGIGALMPWADRLWLGSYVSHGPRTGSGTELFENDGEFFIRKHPESVVGTYANKLVHAPSDQLIIGPHVIDAEGNVGTIRDIQDHRLTATMERLEEPEDKVYFLTRGPPLRDRR